ncbi:MULTISPECIES: glycosyltransferase family 2 protein [Paenibacillus]|uniref:glycosyltransferase family 2 protein n=1 Tax=Paenibacillus TaxID=44249 RepID=UPI0022B93FF8|nr:glycosyltransferase family 2 protein [Paenibacillus caseinilyticus]MCZ8519162.1 glycosyltransferase family 2 protein [Paenibacillus caseinilyticus]
MQSVSIIIPNYNGAPLLDACLQSISRHVQLPHETIVVDNGSNDDSLGLCIRSGVKLISLPDNRGFPAACNLGMRLASGDALLLLNNDTQVTRGGIDNLMRCLYGSEDTGIVGPMSNYASGKQQMKETFTTIDETAERMNRPDSRKWRDTLRVVGLCFLFRRELMERIGELDEQFSPGHFEDDDYCYRARQAGYKLKIAGDAFVYHQGSASFKREREEKVQSLLRTNREKFIRKWNADPHDFI